LNQEYHKTWRQSSKEPTVGAVWWVLLILILLIIPKEVLSAEISRIDPLLQNHIAMAVLGEEIPIIIRMADRVAVQGFAVSTRKKGSARAQARSGLIRSLKAKADQSQHSVRKLLYRHGRSNVKSLWMVNGLALKASPSLIEKIAQMSGVASVEFDRIVAIPESLSVQETSTAEQNISLIRAPSLWALGHSGMGVTVAIMDSGVDVNHPDLGPRWRGGSNSWFDPHGEHPDVPTDRDGHGTQVAGVVLGGDNGATVIGVAPDAQWIGAKIFNDVGDAPISAVHDSFQWLLDPDGNPETDDAPDIVNNSWGFETEPDICDELSLVFQPDVQTLKAAGIAVVFSAGNTGPSPSSSVAPANYPESFAVGSIGTFLSEFEISDISARGPSACDGSVFPEVIAPGSFVKTSDLTAGGAIPNSYAFVSGTSFAAPHVSGVMALLLGAFPDTSIASLETALRQSSVDLGVVGEDNTYGYGMIDSLASFNYLSGKTNAELRLLTPNGGESLGGGGSQTIQWGAYPEAATYWVRFSSDGGTSWSRLATRDASLETSYSWSIPNNINSQDCLVNVIAFSDTGQWLSTDSSDAVFSITPASTVLAPNDGVPLTGLSTTNIQWTAHPDAATYWVRFSSDGGTSWSRLATRDASLGTSFSWSIPNNINSQDCLVNVIAFSDEGQWLAADSSDTVFPVESTPL
jgi:serine protease AprX